MQEHIHELNSEVFKNPSNKERPPSEYLEIYRDLTEKLHNFQWEHDKLIQIQDEQQQKQLDIISRHNNTSNSSINRLQNNTNEDEDGMYGLTGDAGGSSHSSIHNINQSVSMSSIICSSPIPPPSGHINNQSGEHNTSNNSSYFDYDQKRITPPPGSSSNSLLPQKNSSSSQSNLSNHSVGSPHSLSSGSNTATLPKFKLDHPTSLSTTINNNKYYASANLSHSKPSTPTIPINGSANNSPSMCTSLTTSPATTPTLHYNHNITSVSPPSRNPTTAIIHNITGTGGAVSNTNPHHYHSHSASLTPSSSSLSLPLTNIVNPSTGYANNNNSGTLINSMSSNGNASLATTPTSMHHNGGSNRNNLATPINGITHNSRSFGDINEAIMNPSGNSISPSPSIAGTPTFAVLRIVIGNSTAVVSFSI